MSHWQLSLGLFVGTAILFTHRHRKKSRPRKTSKPRNITRNHKSREQEILDRPDLDQRMLRKAEAVIQLRTKRLVLVIERCTNDHNYSAILRTAEALGVQEICMIDPPDIEDEIEHAKTMNKKPLADRATPEELEQRRQHHFFARNAQEWLHIQDFETTEACVKYLRKNGYDLWVTDLSQHAEPLPIDLSPPSTAMNPKVPAKLALVMGTEAVGCSQYMLDAADKRVYLPLRGFADSLNLSVATALIIHHLFVMDPTLIGGINEEEKHELRLEWYTKLCQQRLLTNSQKKNRQRLMLQIQKCKAIKERMAKPENKGKKLQKAEQTKIDAWPQYEKELAELNALLDPQTVHAAVEEWVQNPPDPLTDLRRADIHRVCYVGKNTKNMNQTYWKDMVATSNFKTTKGQTAAEFREKVKQTETS